MQVALKINTVKTLTLWHTFTFMLYKGYTMVYSLCIARFQHELLVAIALNQSSLEITHTYTLSCTGWC